MSNPQIVPRPPRVPFVRPVHISREDGSGAQWLLASNLSEGGLFVRSSEPPAPGTRVRLDLEARGQTLRFAEGEVVWVRPMDVTRMNQGLPGFGVRFGDLNAESVALVRHLVDVGGTGRGQAKTLPFTSPEAIKQAMREQLHAPASAMMQSLMPTERAPTGDWPAPSPVLTSEPALPQKVIIDLGEEPIELGVGLGPAPSRDEPMVDRAMLRAHVSDVDAAPFRPRRSSKLASAAAAMLLVAVVAGGGLFAWRGLHEAMNADPASEPVTVVTAAPAPVASPEGDGELTAATAEADDSDEIEVPMPRAVAAVAPVAPKPAPIPAPVKRVEPKPTPTLAARSPALEQIALPSGAARAVGVTEQGSSLEIQPELSPGSSIDRVFALSSPARLVIDLKGPTPHGTPKVEGRSGVTSVRLGTRPGGTRLVLDLAREARTVKTENGAITVQLH